MTKTEVQSKLAELKQYAGNRNGKYRRNYRIYHDSPWGTIESIRNPAVVGFGVGDYTGMEAVDTTRSPSLNVIASCVDTLHSKIAQSKVRPFFNTINGSFKDIQCVKQAQHFFDSFFDKEEVHKKVADAFRDACVFDTGVIYVDEENKKIERALPFQVYFRPSEITYNNLSRIAYERKDFPVVGLPKRVREKFKNKSLEYVDYCIYYDIFNHVKAFLANDSVILVEEYDKDELPFIFLYYKNPILGGTLLSVCDMLYDTQLEINMLIAKIKDASQLNPAMTFFVPEGSSVKASQINNRVGNIIQYKPNGTGGTPVVTSTPAFIDNQYLQVLDSLIAKAYDMVGISSLSAQSKKPAGVDSGVALATLEDVESDRFETQLNSVIKCFVNIAWKCIALFDPKEDILPALSTREAIKWKDVVKQSKNMSIQYSAADNLSKDPSTKLQQLQQLAMAGVIPLARVPQLMEIPDLEMGYSLSGNAMDAVMQIIRQCIEEDIYDIPDYVPFPLLKEEIINTQLSLKASGKDNTEDIAKLDTLYDAVNDKELDLTADPSGGMQDMIYSNQIMNAQNMMMGGAGAAPQGQAGVPMMDNPAETPTGGNGSWIDPNQVESV